MAEPIRMQQQLVFAVLKDVVMKNRLGVGVVVGDGRAHAAFIALFDRGLPHPRLRGRRLILTGASSDALLFQESSYQYAG
jgi:hypothetical protein